MKKLILINCLLLIAVVLTFAQQDKFPKLTGPYLGQKPPGMTPEIFAPGIISKDGVQSKLLVVPDGKEIIFKNMIMTGNSPSDRKSSFVSIKMIDGVWGLPSEIPFSTQYVNDEPALSPDGKKLFFVSNRPKQGEAELQKMPDIWMVCRTDSTWNNPINIGAPINTDGVEVQPSLVLTRNYTSEEMMVFIIHNWQIITL
jgi:hypothetical protein